MPRHIIYIINPIAGRSPKKDLSTLIEEKTTAAGFNFHICVSVSDGNYDFLRPIITENSTTDVVIAGGDGTISQVMHSLMNTGVNFGIIPCGSGNGLALAAGISKHHATALDHVFAGYADAIDGFYINDRFACMLCGVGFDAKVAHDFARQSKRGLATYVKQVIRNFFSAKTYLFELHIGERVISVDAFFISIANSNQFGNNFTIAPQASLNDGLLDIVIVTKQNKLRLLMETLLQVLGKNKVQPVSEVRNKKGVIYFQAPQVLIINNFRAPLHIDGDPADTTSRLRVEVKVNCIKLLQPKKGSSPVASS